MAYYKIQNPVTLIDENTLTDSYDDNQAVTDVRALKLMTIYVEYTPVEADSTFYLQVESGLDATNLYPKVALLEEDVTGESTAKSHVIKLDSVGAGTTVKKRILVEVADVKVRLSMKESVSASYGTGKINILKNEE